MDGFEGVLNNCKPKMDAVDQCIYEKSVYKLRDAYDKIWKYMSHNLQSACQSAKWNDVMTYDGKTSICIMDYAMKFDSEYYRWWSLWL